jgi:hypothetical protein
VVAGWCRRHAVTAADLRAPALDLLREVTRTPPRILAEAYFSLDHDEMFGEGGVVTKRGVLPRWAIRRAKRSERGWGVLVRIAENTSWPQGCFVLNRRRRELERYNREHPAASSAPPAAIGVIEAKRQLVALESSRAWRLVNALKRNPIYGLYARRRWGPHWDRGPDFETADDRLARLRATRTYQLVVRMKSNPIVRVATRPLRRGS